LFSGGASCRRIQAAPLREVKERGIPSARRLRCPATGIEIAGTSPAMTKSMSLYRAGRFGPAPFTRG